MKKQQLLNQLEKFSKVRVAVVGDLMLDTYVWGRAGRISPEAPVPVLEVSKVTSCLGGAANVMRNVATLGGQVYAFGMIGSDADGETICSQLRGYNIDPSRIIIDKDRRTTHKQRVVAGTQQLLRIDYEDTGTAGERLREQTADGICRLIKQNCIDAVIFEDYGKGMLCEELLRIVIDEAKKANIITLLDPKPGNLSPVQGLTLMKPNRSEAMAMAGIKEKIGDNRLGEAARSLHNAWQCEELLISLAADGMALSSRGGELKIIPTRAREVFDVSGAGDTVISACALALGSGAAAECAAELGNYAAGIVVGKVGTVTVGLEELQKTIAEA